VRRIGLLMLYPVRDNSAQVSEDDWKIYYGPAWPIGQTAKAKFDPKNLTPGHGMFPS
jgi:hypothetical protein